MRNTLVKSLVAAAVGSLMMVGSASAVPWSGLDTNVWDIGTSDDLWTYTDLTTSNSQFDIYLENADLESTFGLYYVNDLGNVDKYQVFNGPSEAGSVRTLNFQVVEGVTQIQKLGPDDNIIKDWEDFSSIFGFYYTVLADPNYTFYLNSSLNTKDAGIEHITTAYSSSSSRARVYLEDLLSEDPEVDWDFNDMTVYINDVEPVPEPATMLLFGAGLLGLAGVSRRRKMQK